jgi:2,4-dienoyl-CoA reductase-like NADH-dependent reductase (Old Yellow Enzyme family)
MLKMPLLFTPLQIAGTTLHNRVVLSPMCQYCAIDGYADDWHLVHLGKFALGGMALVFTEATAVEELGRISYGDLGIWSDSFLPGLKRIADFVRAQGALPGIQIAHAGRKGGWQRPWQGSGGPLDAADAAQGEAPYPLIGRTAEPLAPGHVAPHALSLAEIAGVVESFASAAARADRAGFEVLEIHGAHGYLISSFLSPGVNRRNDAYGGDRAGRMRFALEVPPASHYSSGSPRLMAHRMAGQSRIRSRWLENSARRESMSSTVLRVACAAQPPTRIRRDDPVSRSATPRISARRPA